MTEPALRLHQLVKRHGRATVLDGVDFALAPGELFGLIGVNGAGKTSLLHCVLDLSAPDAGTITVFGLPHTAPAARAPLAYLPERFLPPYFLNGREFLRYMMTLHGRAYDETAVAAMLGALELDPQALRRTVRDYSKGMTQKLGLAACLLAAKPLLVLDEPMSGLDPKASALLKRQLRAARDGGAAILMTSHALADVEQLCDRIGILHNGRLLFCGTPADCRARFGGADLEQAFLACIG